MFQSCTRFGRTPEAIVTSLKKEIQCDGVVGAPFTMYNAVQLGIICGDTNLVSHSDLYVECGAKSNQFERLDDFGDLGTRWTCAENADFPALSGPSTIQSVNAVSIETDAFWGTSAPSECLEQVADVKTASPVSSPVSTPFTPTAPIPVPVIVRESSSDSDAGAIVGGVLGSIAIIMLAAVLIVLMKIQRSQAVAENTSPKDLRRSEDDKVVELAVRSSINA